MHTPNGIGLLMGGRPSRGCRFARDNCPSYLEEHNFRSLKDNDIIGRLDIVSGTFMDALIQRKYTKVNGWRDGECDGDTTVAFNIRT